MFVTHWRELALGMLTLLCMSTLYRYNRPNPSEVQSELGVSTIYSQPTSDEVYVSQLPIAWPLTTNAIESGDFRFRFLYCCQDAASPLWFSIATTPDEKENLTEVLMYHPLFEQYQAPHVTNSQVWLYQNIFAYAHVEDFIYEPPYGSVIVADDLISQLLPPAMQAIPLSTYQSGDFPDYLLTTYEKPRIFGKYHEFTRIVSRESLPENLPEQLYIRITAASQQSTLTHTMPSFNDL